MKKLGCCRSSNIVLLVMSLLSGSDGYRRSDIRLNPKAGNHVILISVASLIQSYNLFSKRAREIFQALDLNGDGAITEDEFIRNAFIQSIISRIYGQTIANFQIVYRFFLQQQLS